MCAPTAHSLGRGAGLEVGPGAEAKPRTGGRPRTSRLRPRAKRVSSSSSLSLPWRSGAVAGSYAGRARVRGGRGFSSLPPSPSSSLLSSVMTGRAMPLRARRSGTTSSSLSSPFGAREVTGTGPRVRTGCGAGATDRIRTEWLLRAHMRLALGIREHPQVLSRPRLADGLLMVDAGQPSSVCSRSPRIARDSAAACRASSLSGAPWSHHRNRRQGRTRSGPDGRTRYGQLGRATHRQRGQTGTESTNGPNTDGCNGAEPDSGEGAETSSANR